MVDQFWMKNRQFIDHRQILTEYGPNFTKLSDFHSFWTNLNQLNIQFHQIVDR